MVYYVVNLKNTLVSLTELLLKTSYHVKLYEQTIYKACTMTLFVVLSEFYIYKLYKVWYSKPQKS